jgi:endonuclease/exonuclease/phosphatase family metal-dependent hydrolase
MARAGNRDVTADLARALNRYGAWAPMFLESTAGRDDDPGMAEGLPNEESMFGIAVLSRWQIGIVHLVGLPGPEAIQFDVERMVGRFIALVVEIRRPGAPFVAVSVHLEVHRTRAHRAEQMRVLTHALRHEKRPIVLAGDFNSHTFDRGRWHSTLTGSSALLGYPGGALRRRLLQPDRGRFRETLFDDLRAAGFEWEPFIDFEPTLQLRLDRVDEGRGWLHLLGPLTRPLLGWAERRARLRLDWIAGRGWKGGRGRTVPGLDGPGLASDHAPIVAEFE